MPSPKSHMIMTQAKHLPKGYVWQIEANCSGILRDPNGNNVFEFSLSHSNKKTVIYRFQAEKAEKTFSWNKNLEELLSFAEREVAIQAYGSSNPTRICIDMDGVLFNFAKRYADLYSEEHPDDPRTEEDIIQNWDVTKTTKYGDKLWKEKGFFIDMEPYPGAKEFFSWLYRHYDTMVLSTAPAYQYDEKDRAMELLCPEWNSWDALWGNRKERVIMDYLIDDAPHHCKNIGSKVIVFDRPYNADITNCAARVHSFDELRTFIEENCIPRICL